MNTTQPVNGARAAPEPIPMTDRVMLDIMSRLNATLDELHSLKRKATQASIDNAKRLAALEQQHRNHVGTAWRQGKYIGHRLGLLMGCAMGMVLGVLASALAVMVVLP